MSRGLGPRAFEVRELNGLFVPKPGASDTHPAAVQVQIRRGGGGDAQAAAAFGWGWSRPHPQEHLGLWRVPGVGLWMKIKGLEVRI